MPNNVDIRQIINRNVICPGLELGNWVYFPSSPSFGQLIGNFVEMIEVLTLQYFPE